MKIQSKTKSVKRQMSSRLIGDIRKEVETTARKFDCSKSFVIAVALADYFGIKNQENYK